MQPSWFACGYVIFLKRDQQFRKFPISEFCDGCFSQYKIFRNFSWKNTYPAKIQIQRTQRTTNLFCCNLKSKVYHLLLHCTAGEKHWYGVVIHALWVFQRTEYSPLIHHNVLMEKWLILFHREANTSLVISALLMNVW